jgi:hypothetical protein
VTKANGTDTTNSVDATKGTAAAGARPKVGFSQGFADNTIYADGFHALSLRGGVVRLELYQAITPASEKAPEQRVVTHRLVMPLAALGEISRMISAAQREAEKAKGLSGEKRE